MISWRVPSNFSLAFFEGFRTSALISDSAKVGSTTPRVPMCVRVCLPDRS